MLVNEDGLMKQMLLYKGKTFSVQEFLNKNAKNSWTIQTNVFKYISNKFWRNVLSDIWIRQSRILSSDLSLPLDYKSFWTLIPWIFYLQILIYLWLLK